MLTDGPRPHNESGGRVPLLLIFLLSGASGLIYQVVWSRSMTLVFGSTTHAVSTVLAAFMGGLALGSVLVGRMGDRLRRPLRAYAFIEIAIAVLAVAVLMLVPAMAPMYRLAWRATGGSAVTLDVLRFLLACVALVPPTALMGATLPILSAHLERASRRPRPAGEAVEGASTGALYSANTVGAVAGTALAGFVLVPGIGMFRTALVAAAANLAAAVAALRLSRSLEAEPPAASGAAAPAAAVSSPSTSTRSTTLRLAPLLLAFGVSGAAALVLEVGWTRVLSLVLGSSTHAFSIMLTTFLAGLAIGSACATRWLRKAGTPMLAFALVEMLAGLSAFLGLYLFPELPYAFLKVFSLAGGQGILFEAGRFLVAALVMLPPTLLLGATFPLAARAALSGRGAVAGPVAVLYTANTVGAIAGALAAGFFLVPALGLQGSLVAASSAMLAAGAFLLACSGSGSPALRRGLASVVLVCLPVMILGAPEWNRAVMTSGVFQYAPRYLRQFASRRHFLDYHAAHAQLFYRDGPTTTVAVEKRPEREQGKVNLVLSVNGKVDASSVGDMESQVLVGQVPMLAAPRAESVLVIGMGSGVTAGSTLTHPLKELSVVEIEPAVIEAQRHFEEINGRPLMDPRTTLRINDARNELLVSDETYDVIISEPSNPWLTGPSKLFTREFFELARSRLNQGGVLCQWVQLYGMDPSSLAALLRTYATVFPHRLVFKGAPGDLLVLGSQEPITLDIADLSDRMARPEVARDLARVQVLDLADLLARFRLGNEGVEAYVASDSAGDGPLNTDDNALIEFAAARSLYREDTHVNDAALARVSDSILPSLRFDARASDGGGVQADAPANLAAVLAERLIKIGLLDRAALLIDQAGRQAPSTPEGLARLQALQGSILSRRGDEGAARAAWEEALRTNPREARARLGIAKQHLSHGDPRSAIARLEGIDSPACRVELAGARLSVGDPRGALAALEGYRDSVEGRPRGVVLQEESLSSRAALYRGRALFELGKLEAAVAELSVYFESVPEDPRPAERSIEGAVVLARAHLALGHQREAIAQMRIVAGLADSLASWHRHQANRFIENGDRVAALGHLREAVGWNPADQISRRLLGRALNDLGNSDEALRAWGELNRAMGGDAEALKNIAGLSLRMNRPGDAMAAFQKLRDLEGNPEVLAQIDAAIRELGGS